MTKLNPYLIENKAQVVEIREIENKELITPEEQAKIVDKLVKNEIPSYEEFMKTYQEDEGAADSYYYEIDSYGDIRVVKCYGPGFWEDVVEVAGFAGRIAVTTAAAGAIVASGGTAAPLIGAGMWVGGKAVEEIGKETDCQFLRTVGGLTKDTGFGSMTGLALADANVVKNCADAGINIKKLCDIKDKGEVILALRGHTQHRNRGISYDRNCDVCIFG